MVEYFTTATQLGISIAETIKHARKLTVGEIAMCRLIFKDAIDYNTVYILDNQIMNRGASIFGVIIFPAEKKSKDFSKENDLTKQVLFIHEMTHVWQFQKDFPVLLSGAKMQWFYKIGNNPYKYDLEPQADDRHRNNPNSFKGVFAFNEYNMESQAELLSHYYAITTFKTEDVKIALGITPEIQMTASVGYLYEVADNVKIGMARRAILKQCVEAFIASPKDKNYIPRDPYILGYSRAK